MRPDAPAKDGKPQTQMLNKDQMKRTTDFRKQYASDKTTVNTQLAKDTWLRAKTVLDSDSPAGQIAAVYSFMKSLDPTSTVRESEYATAESARAAIDSATNYANKITEGKRLTAGQIKDFRGIMEKLYKRQMLEQKAKNQEYRNLANRFGVAEQDVGFIEDTEPTPTPAAQGARGYQIWAP
jgi:serine/threonine-protein kinase RIO1